MQKKTMVDFITSDSEVSRKEAEQVLKSFFKFVTKTLKDEGKLQITGLGTFKVNQRKNLTNPKTGLSMGDKQVKYVSFKNGTAIKDAIN